MIFYTFQTVGRNMLVFMIISQEPTVAEFEVTWWLIVVWSSVEVIRFYTLLLLFFGI